MNPKIADAAPNATHVTDYDRSHAALYLRLLDAADEGAPWEEAAHIVLGIDPAREPARARSAYESHLARARWLTAQGYRDLLKTPN
ncbi:DNA -binding domain-containing protein [Acidiphilium sp.]|uniref:DNA -binding domain-containing protein n=1 Tax=Acidiphilium sp. TaxID=527 RepID=UPI002BC9C785|nr:DUF2285 domain-containing protein [Acidiphilium sp.]HQT62087.1 DUF2285 domain-containing protein [Acidiphilium sp.]